MILSLSFSRYSHVWYNMTYLCQVSKLGQRYVHETTKTTPGEGPAATFAKFFFEQVATTGWHHWCAEGEVITRQQPGEPLRGSQADRVRPN